MGWILLIAMFAGLMVHFTIDNAKWNWVGKMVFIAAVAALLFALAPFTVKLLH